MAAKKKRKTRRQRSDSVTAQVKAAQDAGKVPMPPDHVHLRDRDHPFWMSIVRARSVEHWTDVDLENAANLARCKADIERLQTEVDQEGDTVTNARGTLVPNPKHNLIETLTRRALALSRALHVHAEATVGESREEAKRNSESRKARKSTKDDSLLAKPH